MTESILNSTKHALGLTDEYTVFDDVVILHINTAFSEFTQLGVGPKEGYFITDADNVWTEFLGESKRLELTKTCLYMKVKLIFDPPETSFAIDAINKVIERLEWRMNFEAEGAFVEQNG